jgi:transcriptional regulator with XRE-family HTH domain
MHSTRKQFADNLRRHRTRAGLTQEALAFACDLHPTAVGKLERQERTPRRDRVGAGRCGRYDAA